MMKRFKQFDPLIIDDFEVDQWPYPLHNHNHYEIIFVAHGKGNHHLNNHLMPYQEGDLFLLGPEDEHEFLLETKSRFIYFKFIKPYLSEVSDFPLPESWNQHVDRLLQSPERKNGNLLHQPEDRTEVCRLMGIISDEYARKGELHQRVIFQLFTIVVLIVIRNLKGQTRLREVRKASIAEHLLEYVEANIYDPTKLTLGNLSDHFHYSPNYLSSLFKTTIGLSLREYIGNYRYKLISERMKFGQVPQKQLVSEFGFVDESHLHKFMKSRTGKKMKELREEP